MLLIPSETGYKTLRILGIEQDMGLTKMDVVIFLYAVGLVRSGLLSGWLLSAVCWFYHLSAHPMQNPTDVLIDFTHAHQY